MKKIKTSEAIGPALDWLVYLCYWGGDVEKYGDDYLKYKGRIGDGDSMWSPSTSWQDGGPIVERGRINLRASGAGNWVARSHDVAHPKLIIQYGPTALIAAMRCCVVSKLGDEVEVPEEL